MAFVEQACLMPLKMRRMLATKKQGYQQPTDSKSMAAGTESS
jgi:hypothetical protein